MTDQTKIQADAAAEAPAKVAKTVAATLEASANETAKTAKRARATTARRAKRSANKSARVTKARTARKPSARKARAAQATRRTVSTAARKPAAAFTQTIQDMTFSPNAFPGFEAFTGSTPFQSLLTDAGERGQEVAKKSQKVAQELAEITRSNVEAVVEAGRLAAEGVRSLGQDAVARSREGAEQAADAIRSLTEAKSPTEFVQLQSEIARTSFDRMVAESSRFTESMVKLAGKAFQPLSNRATVNAERINNIVA